jgi:hypothetical protein
MIKTLALIMGVCVLAAGACGKSGATASGTGGSSGAGGVQTGAAGSSSAGAAGTIAAAGTDGVAGTTGAAGTVASAAGNGGSAGPGGLGGSAPLVPAFAEAARDFAATYVSWGRVDDEWRWAPALCRIPLPGVARVSESNDPATHGQKLYSVFAKLRAAYPEGPQTGQVVVKQSWRTEEVTDADAGYAPTQWRPADGGSATTDDHFYPYAKGEDGGVFHATEFAGLYIMWKVDPATPDTDEGWVYATILPSGEVTAAGRVSSCMGCHEEATHERLFGVPTGAFGI